MSGLKRKDQRRLQRVQLPEHYLLGRRLRSVSASRRAHPRDGRDRRPIPAQGRSLRASLEALEGDLLGLDLVRVRGGGRHTPTMCLNPTIRPPVTSSYHKAISLPPPTCETPSMALSFLRNSASSGLYSASAHAPCLRCEREREKKAGSGRGELAHRRPLSAPGRAPGYCELRRQSRPISRLGVLAGHTALVST